MSNKLQNIKAIKQMMAGEHKTQTRKSYSFGNKQTQIPKMARPSVCKRWITGSHP